jgi:hypothetical protein
VMTSEAAGVENFGLEGPILMADCGRHGTLIVPIRELHEAASRGKPDYLMAVRAPIKRRRREPPQSRWIIDVAPDPNEPGKLSFTARPAPHRPTT